MSAADGDRKRCFTGPSRVPDYEPGTGERAALDAAIDAVRAGGHDVPCVIGGREVRTGRTVPIAAPHDHANAIGRVHHGSASEIDAAIDAAAAAAPGWGTLAWQERAAVFLRAADLLQCRPWRERLVAATMVELSKTAAEADGDAACEMADLFRINVDNMIRMYADQPESTIGASNAVEYRPLEGFVLAISPFNFTSMNNLAFAPALLGNTVVWKPAEATALVSYLSMQLLREAGLPDGVVNLVHGDGGELGPIALAHRDLAAVAFTGSTTTFQSIWETVGANIRGYRGYPRLVGETGGKGFVLVHPSADLAAVAQACVQGAYGYQGQKCSAASRLYAPRSSWPELRDRIVDATRALTVADPTLPGTDVGAVITERQLRKHEAVLQRAAAQARIPVGGGVDTSNGWFVEPTLCEVPDPHSRLMTEEFFGPILSAYVYDDADWAATMRLVDESTPYGLAGSVFADDAEVLADAGRVLRYAAGNL